MNRLNQPTAMAYGPMWLAARRRNFHHCNLQKETDYWFVVAQKDRGTWPSVLILPYFLVQPFHKTCQRTSYIEFIPDKNEPTFKEASVLSLSIPSLKFDASKQQREGRQHKSLPSQSKNRGKVSGAPPLYLRLH